MLRTATELQEISKLREGSLAQVPFAVLLRALSEQQRTVVLEIRRRQLVKRVIFEFGTPVDCSSNLVHERLGRFLVSQGKLDSEAADRLFNQSVAKQVPFGNMLVLEGVLTPWELYRALQQNLAKKLLDGFAWSDGEFKLLFEVPEVDSPLHVKVPQLILTGLTRFAPQEEMDAAAMTLIGKRIALHPSSTVIGDLRLTPSQRATMKLLEQPRSLVDLEAGTGLEMDAITRFVYACMVLGVVVTEDQLPALEAQRTPIASAAPAPAPAAPAARRSEAEIEALRNEIMRVYLAYRGQDAFDLLELEETADLAAIRNRYLEFAERFAPWKLLGSDVSDLREKATHLFLVAARAYADLADTERRNTLLFRRQNRREKEEKERRVGPERIKTDLLDSEVQFEKGKELMAAGEYREALQFLEFASDCDPQNGLYRAELAYCRFLWSPAEADGVLRQLDAACRIDPGCGLAHFYRGQVCAHVEQFDEAEASYRRAIKSMNPDRRPIEALKELTGLRKKAGGRRR